MRRESCRTDSGSTVRTANFENILSGPITVEGGDGFVLRVARNGNTHQTDAILLDVTFATAAIPEPSTGMLGFLGAALFFRRLR
ncbi:MAG: hypothetical protein AB8D78_15270 [Akkermansiaceae bacterium]